MVENKVKEYREKLGLSQEQLAEKAGIGRSTISEIESGRHTTTIEIALILAEMLGVDVSELFILQK